MLIITYAQEGTYRQRVALIRTIGNKATVSIGMPGNKHILQNFSSPEECILYADSLLLDEFPLRKIETYTPSSAELY